MAAMMNLDQYLDDTGLSRSEFAKRLGVSPGRLSQLRGKPWPPELALTLESVTGGKVSACSVSPVIAAARQ